MCFPVTPFGFAQISRRRNHREQDAKGPWELSARLPPKDALLREQGALASRGRSLSASCTCFSLAAGRHEVPSEKEKRQRLQAKPAPPVPRPGLRGVRCRLRPPGAPVGQEAPLQGPREPGRFRKLRRRR